MDGSNKARKSTYDFVRETGRDRYFDARDREIAMLADSSGGIRAEFAEPVTACPVCGHTQFNFWFEKQNFRIMTCADEEHCSHIFADPQINEDALMEFYRGDGDTGDAEQPTANDLWIEVLLSSANVRYDQVKYKKGLEAIEKAMAAEKAGKRRVLDIGCSIGHFLAVAHDAGWNTIGLELNTKAVAHARDVLGLDVRPRLLHEADLESESFDAVTLWGVIEHLKRPVEVLKQIMGVLKPGGVLLTFCPNGASLVCRILREKAATFDGRNHPSYFTPKSLRFAMKLAGLENLSVSSHQPDLGAVINYIEGRDPYVKKIDMQSPLHEFFSDLMRENAEKFILEKGLGYKIMSVNRKPL